MKPFLYIASILLGLSALFLRPLGLYAADAPAKTDVDEKLAIQRRKLAMQFDAGQRWAFIIGINKYKDPKISSLRFCVQDAALMADVLATKCAYPKENILLLNDNQPPERIPTKANILRELTGFLKKVKKGDTVLFYYAGHGDLANGLSLIDVQDVQVADAAGTGLPVEHVRDMLRESAATQKLLVLDCCHSGTVKGGIGFSGEDIGDKKSAGGLITFAGCRRGQTSQESAEVGHGLLTYCLARGLGGEADYDHDGIVDSDEIYRFLFSEVPTMAEKMDPKNGQTPVRIIGEDVTGLFALSRVVGDPFTVAIPGKISSGDLISNSLGMKLAIIKQGKFKAGSPANESGHNDDEREWEIEMNSPFFMSTCEVTQAQFEKVMGKNPSYYCKTGDGADDVKGMDTSQFPVEQVTWEEAADFCAKLSKLPSEKAKGLTYRLPTEAEWEFACRAGTTTIFNTGDLLSSTQANVNGDKPYLNSPDGPNLKRTTTVGSYKPNAWGLYDMHGNTWEWCNDYYMEKPFLSGTGHIDPTGPSQGTQRVMRGGSFTGDVSLARSAQRRGRDADYRNRSIGFRIVAAPTLN